MIADMGFSANQARKALRETVCHLVMLLDLAEETVGRQSRTGNRMALLQP